MKPILIHFSRKNLMGFSVVGIAFFLGSYWIAVEQPNINFLIINDRFSKILLGSIGMLFSTLLTYFYIKKGIQNKPALVIDEEGIVDNASAFSCGRIYWHEIFAIEETGVKSSFMHSEKFITVMLCDPQNMMDKQSYWRKKWMSWNASITNSPCNFSARSLAMKHNEVLLLLQQTLQENCR